MDILRKLRGIMDDGGKGDKQKERVIKTIPLSKDLQDEWKAIRKEEAEMMTELNSAFESLYNRFCTMQHRTKKFWLTVEREHNEYGGMNVAADGTKVNVYANPYSGNGKDALKNLAEMIDDND